MPKNLVGALTVVMVMSLSAFAADSQTTLVTGIVTTRDSLTVLGNIAFAESDSSSHILLLLNPGVAIHGIYFLAENDSITAHYERIQGDTVVVARSTLPAFAQSRILSFDLAFPLDPANDSLIMLDRGNRWYPVLPHGLTNAIVQVTVEADREVFSTGDETVLYHSGATTHQFIARIPVYKIPLVLARKGYYRSCSKAVGNHEVVMKYFSVTDSAALKIVDQAVSAFAYFQQLIGDYPHKRLLLVEAPGFEGVNIGTGVLSVGSPTMKALAAGQYETLTLTIAAQWFGSGVFCDFPSPGFWFMNLSLSHYLRLFYEGRNLDSAQFAAKMQENLAAYEKIAGGENDVPIIDIVRPDTREKGVAIYSKGPFLVERLRNCLGSSIWDRNLRQVYREYLGKVISIDGFVEGLGKSESGCAKRLREDISRKGM